METAILYEVGEEVTAVVVGPTQQGFDYGLIDEGIRDEVKSAARAIHQLGAGIVTGIVAIGKRLIEVKGMIPHGQFAEWVMGEFQMNERAAQRMMNVAREYGDPQKRQSLSLFSPSVLYLLAAPSTPEEARAEVEQMALSGQKVTVDAVKKAAAKFTEPKPSQPRAEVKRVAEPHEKPTPAPAKVVYLEPKAEKVIDPIVTYLIALDLESEEFSAVLLNATVEQLEAALGIIPTTDEWRWLKIGNRRKLLMRSNDLDDSVKAVKSLSSATADQPDDEELAAIAAVAAERAEEEQERAERDAAQGITAYVDPEVAEVEPYGMFAREWVLDNLLTPRPEHPDFLIALNQLAKPDDLREALCSFDQEDKYHEARRKAIVARLAEMEPPTHAPAPDPRIAEAQALIELMTAARDAARRSYERLCGKHLDLTTYERMVSTMTGRLQSLVTNLKMGVSDDH